MMGKITLPLDIIQKLNEIAKQENRSVEEALGALLDEYAAHHEQDRQMREFRSKLYKMAREYWRKTGDQARLALTDAELDDQFWMFDQDDIPRLKSDQGKIPTPVNPGLSLVGLLDLGTTDAARDLDEWRRQHFEKRFGSDR
jgi:hypothetical protein